MGFQSRDRTRGAAIAGTLLFLALSVGPASAVGPNQKREGRSFLDVRSQAASVASAPGPAQAALRRSLGTQGVVDVDPLTGTPRVVARLDGFLTGPSNQDAQEIVLQYVRAHAGVFKLDEDDLAALRLTRDYTDIGGTRHLTWAQTYRGIPAFDNDLRASVTSDGRLVNVLGSPQPDLAAPTTSPALDVGGALVASLRDAGRPALEPRVVSRASGVARATRFAGGHRAGLVLFVEEDGVRLAWHVTARASSSRIFDYVVDASSGQILRRANKVEHASGLAWDYYPSTAAGAGASSHDFTGLGWLGVGATTLNGPNTHVFLDLDDDDGVDSGEAVGPAASGNWDRSFDSQFTHASGLCAPTYTSQCSWKWNQNASWSMNSKQNATQVFYFVNNFHDHLEAAPIGFTPGAGNFEGADKVVAHADDGATTDGFFPDQNHVNNANMFTPPNGTAPTMQMYLFTSLTGDIATDPTPDSNGGDDASVVYHEYVHGLSNRLITYADGWGALDAFQSGAMGEAWSDWYAMDYLAGEGFAPDDPGTDGEVIVGSYLGNGQSTIRSEGLDCPADSVSAACPGTASAGSGGYTYGDLGKVWAGGPEVHADGEIWAQTLWDVRSAVGVATARSLVTRAMELSPRNPSFLDMRNAILQADTVNFGGANRAAIWQAFADRGMGFFASSSDGNDLEPVENFDLPPDEADGEGTLTGVVRNGDTNLPVAGVAVEFAGHASGFLGDLADITDSLGRYTISNVPVGTYPEVVASRTGYDHGTAADVDIAADTIHTRDLSVRRDWAAYSGGARVTKLTGPNYAMLGCGPNQAIDQSLATGWASDVPGGSTKPSITVKLPAYVDVTAFAVDPGATCGDPDDASLASYRIEVSKSGSSFAVAKTGSFGAPNNHQLNLLSLGTTRKAVRYVRLTMLTSQGHLTYLDMSELVVYGKPTPVCLGAPATKVGTAGANTLNGTSGADVIVGLAGNDRIDGRGGNDVICGGDGADRLTGAGGTDKFDGGGGNDTLYARDARKEKTVRGGSGSDRARIDRGSDRTSGVERLF